MFKDLLMIFIAFIFTLVCWSSLAHSAEANLPITVRILNCSTVDLSWEVCLNEDKCCDVLDEKLLAQCEIVEYNRVTDETIFFCDNSNEGYYTRKLGYDTEGVEVYE